MVKFYNNLQTSYLPLLPWERKRLMLGLYLVPVFLLFGGAVCYFMLSNIRVSGAQIFIYFISGMAAIGLGIVAWSVRDLVLDLRDNEKMILKGQITRKEYVNFSRGKKENQVTYFFYFGEEKIRVRGDLYYKFNEGDFIEIQMAKRSYDIIFKSSLIQPNTMSDGLKTN